MMKNTVWSCTLIALATSLSACVAPSGDDLAAADESAASQSDALSADKSFVTAHGTELRLAGKDFGFLGVNVYDLAGGPGASRCYLEHNPGHYGHDLDVIFGQLAAMKVNAVRFWASQSYAGASGHDFTLIDEVVAHARARHIRLIPVLEDYTEFCSPTNARKTTAWFQGGYKHHYGYPLTFPGYIERFVEHFRDEPAILAYQIMNEAECEDAAALRAFAHETSGLIKSLDHHHLVSFGTLGSGQHGIAGDDYRKLHEDPNIDLVEAHDYGYETHALTPYVAADLAVANALHKPFFLGEMGIDLGSFSRADRARYLDAKLKAAAHAGISGVLIWSFGLGDGSFQFNATSGDPLVHVLEKDRALY